MKVINFLIFSFLSFVLCFEKNILNAKFAQEKKENIKDEVQKEFELDFLKIFPYYDFKEKDLHSIIAYFESMVTFYNFNKFYKDLDSLQTKYRDNLDIVRQICFVKLIMCYITIAMKIPEYNETINLYHHTISFNPYYSGNVNKLIFMIEDKNLSNNSEYCIDVKSQSYHNLLHAGLTDEKIDLFYLISQQLSSLIKLDRLSKSIEHDRQRWVEALWYCMNIIKEGRDSNLDIYYYVIIKFLYFQNLFELAECFFEEFKIKCPNSDLISNLNAIFSSEK